MQAGSRERGGTSHQFYDLARDSDSEDRTYESGHVSERRRDHVQADLDIV